MENIGGLGNPSFDLKINGPQPDTQQAVLKINQVLQGEVLQLLDGNTIVLGVGQYRVPAQSHVELRLGDKFQFRVEQQNGEIVLKILPDPNAQAQPQSSFQLYQQLAGKDQPIAEVMGRLAEVLVALGENAGNGQSGGKVFAGPSGQPLSRESLNFLQEVIRSMPKEQLLSLQDAPSQPSAATSPAPSANTPTPNPTQSAPATGSVPTTPLPATPVSQGTTPAPVLPTGETSLPEVFPLPTAQSAQDSNAATQSAPTQNPGSPAIPVPATTPSTPEAAKLLAQKPSEATTEKTPTLLPRPVPQLNAPQIQSQVAILAKLIESSVVHENPQPKLIQKNVEESGVPLESRFKQLLAEKGSESPQQLASRDIKSAVLNLEKEVEKVFEQVTTKGDSAAQKSVGELLSSVRESREAIESKQLQNALRQDLRESFHFQIPFREAEKLRTADLFYKKSQAKKKDGKVGELHHLVFLLEMSRVGPLRVDALMRDKKLDIYLRFESNKAAQYVKKQIPELAQTLNGLGFQVGWMECGGGLKKQEERSSETLNLPVLNDRPLLDLEG